MGGKHSGEQKKDKPFEPPPPSKDRQGGGRHGGGNGNAGTGNQGGEGSGK
ncbi:hypothetical protein GCM10022224_070160 [Nonomuraea antimicrobica]|uniref:Uncharacterized protein n=1 Tax=Nonomuraea antimicrobica TaxID=561173 RepID=A0ABP7CU12_9ACTN